MARTVNAKGAKLIGTAEQVVRLLGLLAGDGAAVVKLDKAQIVLTDDAQVAKSVEWWIARHAKNATVRRAPARRKARKQAKVKR